MRKIKVIHLGREFDAVLLPGSGPATVPKPSNPPKAKATSVPPRPKATSRVPPKTKVAKRRVPAAMQATRQGPGYSSEEIRAKLRAAILQSRHA